MGDMLVPIPYPATTYQEAVLRSKAFDANPAEPLHPLGHTRLIGHGHKTENAIIFLHGLTNNPQQFEELGHRFHALGYNVLIPRLPHHGLENLLTTDLNHLTALKLINTTQEAINITHGLAEKIIIVGLSAGGVAAAWAGQFRADVSQVIMLAPFFGIKNVPALFTPPLSQIALWVPNRFMWWDKRLKMEKKPDHAYPRFSTHALAQVMQLGIHVARAAKRTAPACKSLTFVTDGFDASVNNLMIDTFAELCRKSGAGNIHCFEFPSNLRLPHDMIDPTQPKQRIDIVYPKLIELVTHPPQ